MKTSPREYLTNSLIVLGFAVLIVLGLRADADPAPASSPASSCDTVRLKNVEGGNAWLRGKIDGMVEAGAPEAKIAQLRDSLAFSDRTLEEVRYACR